MKWFLYFLGAVFIFSLIFSNRSVLFSRTDPGQDKQLFQSSKYYLGEKGSLVSDDVVYAHAGYEYVNGIVPTQINFEHPPFAKYVFGVSSHVFGNPSWAVVLFTTMLVFSFIFLASSLFISPHMKVVAFIMYIANPLVYGFFTKTLLDVPLAAMLMLSIVCYLRYLQKPTIQRAMLWGVIGGLACATKYPIPSSVLLQSLLLAFAGLRTKRWREMCIVGVTALIAYLATYTQFFLAGNSVIDWLRFEYWRLHWFLGKADAPKGLIIQTVLYGRHRAWWQNNELITYEKYSLLWPASFILFLGSFAYVRQLAKHPLFPMMLWTALSFVIYMLGASNDFYLVPLLPGFVLFGLYPIDRLVARRKKNA